MNEHCPIIPGTQISLLEGTVVKFDSWPETLWVTQFGWYKQPESGLLSNGWYFAKMPAKLEVMPCSDALLMQVVIVSTDSGHPFDPDDCSEPQHKPINPPVDWEWELDRSAISVNTIEERNKLVENRQLPHRKLVRVDCCEDGKARYFTWNVNTLQWDEEVYGPRWVDDFPDEADSSDTSEA